MPQNRPQGVPLCPIKKGTIITYQGPLCVITFREVSSKQTSTMIPLPLKITGLSRGRWQLLALETVLKRLSGSKTILSR